MKSYLISRIKESKYYCIREDCTWDISLERQHSLTIRLVDLLSGDGKTDERLIQVIILKFLINTDWNWMILEVLVMTTGCEEERRDYWVHRRNLDINDLAVHVSCGYKLMQCDAAKSSVKLFTLLTVFLRLLTLLSCSVDQWKIIGNAEAVDELVLSMKPKLRKLIFRFRMSLLL